MLASLFQKKPLYMQKTFTYYIPAPPFRKTGYQEKEFDGITEYIQSLGYEILDFKLQSHSGEEKSGLWIICILGAATKEIFDRPIDYEFASSSKVNNTTTTSEIPLDPSIIHDV